MSDELSSKLDPLTRAAIRHGSDKFGGHLYTPVYHELFRHLRELPIRILEIGVGGYQSPKSGGSSLRMWADYFPFAQIVGLDLEHKELDISPRVRIVQGSQVDRQILDYLCKEHGPFDIVIDDGSHYVPHMKESFYHLYPKMAENGIYVVEDAQTSFLKDAGGHRSGDGTIFQFSHRICLAMHVNEGYEPESHDPIDLFGKITKNVSIYRNQVVFHRGANNYPSNTKFDFDNPEVKKIYSQITAEAAANPSARSYISRIDMAIWGGRPEEAAMLAQEASLHFSNDINLQHELVRLMNWAGRPELIEIFDHNIELIEEFSEKTKLFQNKTII
jgi:hypothetical protein